MLEEILTNFGVTSFLKIERFPQGWINETYKVTASKKNFVLQKMNEIYDAAAVTEDLDSVSEHLEKSGIFWQRPVRTLAGGFISKNGNSCWRLLTYIPGDILTELRSFSYAYQAGNILGRFHLAMKNFEYTFKNPRPPAHRFGFLYSKFTDALDRYDCIDLASFGATIQKMPDYFLSGNLREIIVHGDPKPTNIIFDGEKAVGMVDLDGCMRNNVVVELADAFRSWCGNSEDSPQNEFNLKIFNNAFTGYINGSNCFIIREEGVLLPKAIKAVILGLASRFFIDYFEDRYFSWDPKRFPSRKEHNLARLKNQIQLFNDFCHKQAEIEKFISFIFR